MEQKKNKLCFCFMPCACGRFIHCIHSFVIRSASLRPAVAGLHYATLLPHYFTPFISPTSAPRTRVAPSVNQRMQTHCSVPLSGCCKQSHRQTQFASTRTASLHATQFF